MNQHRSAEWHPVVPLAPWGAGLRAMFESLAHELVLLCAEYRRAIAAERRYEELRRTMASTRGIAEADISRRVFAEMYSAREGG